MRGRLLTASPQRKPSNKKLIHSHQIHIIHSWCSYVVATDVLGVFILAQSLGASPVCNFGFSLQNNDAFGSL